jgi:hypothetical protein
MVPILQGEVTINQLRPLNTRFHLYNSTLAIQIEHSAQLPHINQQRVSTKLLPSHGVPTTSHRDNLSIFAGRANDGLHIFQRPWLQDLCYPSGIELGMDVIDQDRFRSCC